MKTLFVNEIKEKENKMHCLEVIKKMNGEYPEPVHKKGSLKFNDEAGCLVYSPPESENQTNEKEIFNKIK